MNITIRKTDLVRALSKCAPIANKRSPQPVLSCVHIASTDDGVALTATDTFITIRTVAQCEADEGSFAVDAKDLLERLKHMPDGDVRLVSTDKSVAISANGSPRRFTLLTHPGGDFPTCAFPSGEAAVITCDGATLGNAIDAVAYAISPAETRAHVNSMLLEWQGPTLRLVATDGHRLSKYETTCDAAGRGSVLVPLASVGELRKLCDVDSIALRISGTSLVVESGGVSFLTRLVDSQFPPFSQILPAHTTRRVVANPQALASALGAVKVASNSRTGAVRLNFEPGVCRVTTESPEAGEAFDEVAVDCGFSAVVGMNAKYLLDAIGAVDVEQIEIQVAGELDPLMVEAGGLVAVVMPCRI